MSNNNPNANPNVVELQSENNNQNNISGNIRQLKEQQPLHNNNEEGNDIIQYVQNNNNMNNPMNGRMGGRMNGKMNGGINNGMNGEFDEDDMDNQVYNKMMMQNMGTSQNIGGGLYNPVNYNNNNNINIIKQKQRQNKLRHQYSLSNANMNMNPSHTNNMSHISTDSNVIQLDEIALARAISASMISLNSNSGYSNNIMNNPNFNSNNANNVNNVNNNDHMNKVNADLESMKKEIEKSAQANKQRNKIMLITLICIILSFNTLSNIYLLFFNSYSIICDCNESTSQISSDANTVNIDNPSFSPTFNPSFSPTNIPINNNNDNNDDNNNVVTSSPTKTPTPKPLSPSIPSTVTTNNPTTNSPTINPTIIPTNAPTIYDGWNIGDFKISSMNESHNYWLLCDGSYIDNRDYPLLFDVIGYQFGSSNHFSYLYALPNAQDRVISMKGNKHIVGEMINEEGNETISLTEDNLPSHGHHTVASNYACYSTTYNSVGYTSTYIHTASTCGVSSGDYEYMLRGTTTTPNAGYSTEVGDNVPFSIMPPTVVIGNIFIYAGEVCDAC